MKTIAYLHYGNKREYALELTYSIASIVSFLRSDPSDIRLLLITDEKGQRSDLPVDHLLFSNELFAQWTHDGHYSHAAKVHALIWAADQTAGPLALIDTDTYFTSHPDNLFDKIRPGHSVMQTPEGTIGSLDFWRPLLNAAPEEVAGYPITPHSPMNNSGVIGVDQADKAMLAEILPIMEELYAICPVFNIEQFAVTCVLARHTQLTVAPDIVYHYWPYHERAFAHAAAAKALPEFTSENFDRLVASFRPFKIPRKRRMDLLRTKIAGTLFGWPAPYHFAYLAGLSARSSVDAGEANAWAAIAAYFIRQGDYPSAWVRRDFRGLLGKPHAWMTPETARAWQALH